MGKKLLIVVLVLIVFTISFTRSFLGLIGAVPWHYGYSDVFNEDRIDEELAKQIPYLERPIEYQILTGFFIYLIWYLGKSLLGYAIFTWVLLTIFAIIAAIALYKLCELLKIGKERIFWFYIFAPSLIIFGVYNWDVIAVMLTVLAVYFFYKNKFGFSAIFLSLGFNAKLFPVLILPLMLLKTNIKQGIKVFSIFLITSLILNLYFIIYSFDVWKITYLFHGLREPNMDSIWSLTNLSTSTINMLSIVLFLIPYMVLIFFHRKYDLISLSLASIALFLVCNKIFSPQYIIWLLPFFALSQTMTRKMFYSLETANLVVFFSISHWLLAAKEQVYLTISNISTIARSLILAYIVFAILKTKRLETKQI